MNTTKICCLIISLLALAFSVMAFSNNVIWASSESVLPVIAICATLIVGMNLIESITIFRLEQKQEQFSKTIEEIDFLKKDLEELRLKANIALNESWGISMLTLQPFFAFCLLYKAFSLSVSMNDAERADNCLKLLAYANKKIEESVQSGGIDKAKIDKLPSEVSDEIKSSHLYCLVEKRLKEIITKINQIKNTI